VFMDGKWYTVDPTFNEIGFIDSGHLTEGYNLSTLNSSYLSAEGSNIVFGSYDVSYPELTVISTTSTSNILPIINITPKWRVINVNGNTVTYEITGIFNNSRNQGYIVGMATLWVNNDPYQVFVGKDNANASWTFNYNFPNLANYNYILPLTISTDPIPITSANFNVYTAPTFEIYKAEIPDTIQQGQIVNLNVTVRNIGAKNGNTNVKFYVNNTEKLSQTLFVPGISGTNTTSFIWNTAGLSIGNYTIKLMAGNDEYIKNVVITQSTCSNDNDCASNQICNSTTHLCQDLICQQGQTPINHTCVDCTQYDLDGNNITDIFDVVAGLENLSYGKEIYNKECTARNNNKIDLFDLLAIMEKLITGEI
ncbi:MAG: CARDB domain-containing protein, partial [Candidatus Altarchaeaceae archaeon]